jgi:hypothetical protein
MKISRLITQAVGCLLVIAATGVQAQWQWRDADGRMQLSDRPPPSSVPDKDIIRRPAGARAPTQPSVQVNDTSKPAAAPVAAAPRPALAASAPSGTDRELERRKKAEEEAKAAQKAEQDAALARRRADNCQRAQTALAALQSGVRMSTVNAKGEREFMDDAARQAEAARIQEIVNSDCR